MCSGVQQCRGEKNGQCWAHDGELSTTKGEARANAVTLQCGSRGRDWTPRRVLCNDGEGSRVRETLAKAMAMQSGIW